MSLRERILEQLIQLLQFLLDDHRRVHQPHPSDTAPSAIRCHQTFTLINRQYWHYLYRKPQSEIVNPKSAIE